MNVPHLLCLPMALLACRCLGAGSAAPGFVIGWGDNAAGQATGIPATALSNGVVVTSGSLFATGTVTMSGRVLSDTVAVTAGLSYGLVLCGDGTIIGWGENIGGAAVGYETPYPGRTNGLVTISGNVLSNITAITAGRTESLALKRDGTVVGWGNAGSLPFDQAMAKVPAGLTNVIAISAGRGFDSHALGLKKDGTVVAWGGGNPPPVGLSNVVAIAANDESGANLALKADGTVVEWAVRGLHYVPMVPQGLSNVTAIAAAHGQRLALQRNGTVFGWGRNGFGEATGTPTERGNYNSSGRLVTIGGQTLSNAVTIAAGDGYSLALKADGTVVAWGRMNNGLQPAVVPEGLSNVVAIAAGDSFCLAITTNAAVAERFRR